jgi:hypothetical protein
MKDENVDFDTKKLKTLINALTHRDNSVRKDERKRIIKILESYKIDECGADFTPDDAEVNDFIYTLIRKIKQH